MSTQLHRELIEFIAESDDALLNKFFEEGSLSEEEFRAGIHAAVQAQIFIPLFCTSATSNVGVRRLLDFIAKYGSSPLDHEKVDAEDARSGAPLEVKIGGTEPVLQVFKTMNEEHFGELSFFRIYSGQITTGGDLFNANRNYHRTHRTDFSAQRPHARDSVASRRGRHWRDGETQEHAHRRHTLRVESSGETSRAGISAPEHSRRAASQGAR